MRISAALLAIHEIEASYFFSGFVTKVLVPTTLLQGGERSSIEPIIRCIFHCSTVVFDPIISSTK
jgi:hypothetical protein